MTPFARRRARLAAQMMSGTVAVLETAPEVTRNGDVHYPYRHNSAFYYLTGFTDPEAALVLVAATASAPARSVLFCRAKNLQRETWEGFRYGPDAARSAFGVDEAHPIGELAAWLGQADVQEVAPLIDAMRVIKDAEEQATMLRAATISGQAHARAMRAARPGMFEYELEAELLYEFRRNGAQAPAYPSIVATGANACVLHYSANDAQTRDGDLVLIDAGCEFDSYASDITRTFPVNGRFSAPQRQLYELVLAAQAAALSAVVPGRPYNGIHDAAVRVLTEGMFDCGLLSRDTAGSVDDAIASRAYQQFYMHGTGHWLGLDVHDAGRYRDDEQSRPLMAGMALTVEPGIYVRPGDGVPEQFWNIGIRIEDDVIVGERGARILSGAAPKTIAEIEEWMVQT
ncbi:MAG: aminopeptidase P N-terminal domain-containing protein [Pseudomonadota bacterium]|nr:aminopeptidase P N-terminal domain-containing protein [Pseudomonadota bacterium]